MPDTAGASSSPRTSRVRRSCCCSGCLLVLLLPAIPIYLAFSPPPPPPLLNPTQKVKVEAQIAEHKSKMVAIEKAAAARKAQPFTLRLSEDEINHFLATDKHIQSQLAERKIERAWVRLADGRIHATATMPEGLAPITLTATVMPEVRAGGTLDFRVEGVDLGRLGIPASRAVQEAAGKALALINNASMIPKAKFTSAAVEDGAIVLTGNTK